MGLFSSSNKQSVSNIYDTDTFTTQADQSGNSGINFAQTGAISLSDSHDDYSSSNSLTVLSDSGAIEAARSIASNSFDLGGAALEFGNDALSTVARVNSDSLSLLGGLVSGAIDNSRTLARDAMEASSQATSDAIAGFSSLAKQTSSSSDDRVTKLALGGIVALAAIFILPPLFRSSGRAVMV